MQNPPTVPEMLKAGMTLTDALAFYHIMLNTPGHKAETWRELMKDVIQEGFDALSKTPQTLH